MGGWRPIAIVAREGKTAAVDEGLCRGFCFVKSTMRGPASGPWDTVW